jgi:hypothetical protein
MSPLLIRTCPFSIKAAFSGFIGGTAGAFAASDSNCFIGGVEFDLAIHLSLRGFL